MKKPVSYGDLAPAHLRPVNGLPPAMIGKPVAVPDPAVVVKVEALAVSTVWSIIYYSVVWFTDYSSNCARTGINVWLESCKDEFLVPCHVQWKRIRFSAAPKPLDRPVLWAAFELTLLVVPVTERLCIAHNTCSPCPEQFDWPNFEPSETWSFAERPTDQRLGATSSGKRQTYLSFSMLGFFDFAVGSVENKVPHYTKRTMVRWKTLETKVTKASRSRYAQRLRKMHVCSHSFDAFQMRHLSVTFTSVGSSVLPSLVPP